MSVKIYEYKMCGTCRKALKYLDEKGIAYEKLPIRETPPTIAELQFMLEKTENVKKLLNTSGVDYRKLGMKDKVKEMSDQQILELIAENGNLIKRPFVICTDKATTGFKEEAWDEFFA
ncbi:MAG: Spx/MgsR family RNA polymerase-binding regulatory protein [Lentisphaeraceae bacterium]|nr:Spx/MgsR family RNA polymerase-binding regulatory protein [Lentisphaeraceae bacterium]